MQVQPPTRVHSGYSMRWRFPARVSRCAPALFSVSYLDLTRSDDNEEFSVAAVFEEEPQMLGIQPELCKLPANPVCNRLASRCSSPAVTAAGMFELEIAAVFKVKQGLGKGCVYGVPGCLCFGEIGQHSEMRRVTKPGSRQSVYLRAIRRGISMFVALFVILLALWVLGWGAMHVAGAAIHILLILAVV